MPKSALKNISNKWVKSIKPQAIEHKLLTHESKGLTQAVQAKTTPRTPKQAQKFHQQHLQAILLTSLHILEQQHLCFHPTEAHLQAINPRILDPTSGMVISTTLLVYWTLRPYSSIHHSEHHHGDQVEWIKQESRSNTGCKVLNVNGTERDLVNFSKRKAHERVEGLSLPGMNHGQGWGDLGWKDPGKELGSKRSGHHGDQFNLSYVFFSLMRRLK